MLGLILLLPDLGMHLDLMGMGPGAMARHAGKLAWLPGTMEMSRPNQTSPHGWLHVLQELPALLAHAGMDGLVRMEPHVLMVPSALHDACPLLAADAAPLTRMHAEASSGRLFRVPKANERNSV